MTLANGPIGMKCTPEALINGPERIHSQELLRTQPKPQLRSFGANGSPVNLGLASIAFYDVV